jgi:hypothetical protein
MDKDTFILRLKDVVYDRSIASVLASLSEVPASQCRDSGTAHIVWYSSLSERDKAMVQEVIEDAVHAAMFSFMMVLDGTESIRLDDEPDGVLELRYRTKDAVDVLLTEEGDPLHDVFGALVPLKD